MKFYFFFPFSDKIFCDIRHVMNHRNILRGVEQSDLSAPPAALIYRAVLCCIFAVSLSIIHETQIPFTFFRDFLKKVFGGDGKPHRHPFGMPPPLIGAALAGRRIFGVWRFAPFGSAGVMFTSAADDALGAPAIRLKNESHAKASPTRGGGIERQR